MVILIIALPALSCAQNVLLTGVVWNKKENVPVENAQVRIYLGSKSGELTTQTDDQGKFLFQNEQLMNSSDFAIIITKEGFHRLNGAVRPNYGEGSPRHFNLYRVSQPQLFVREEESDQEATLAGAPVNNLIFLIDVSGSMAEQNRLENLKSSLRFLVSLYRPDDKISIISYSTDIEVLLEGGNTDQREAVDSIIQSLKPTGITKGVAGLIRAYDMAVNLYLENGNNKVILATDGIFGEDKKSRKLVEDVIIHGRSQGISLSIFSYGEEAATVTQRLNDWSILGKGQHTHIKSLDEAKAQIVREARGE